MSGTNENILWHDYETSGIDSRSDRPMSFAAVRTNDEFEETGEPVVVARDEGPRPLTMDELAAARPYFKRDGGTITALNASRGSMRFRRMSLLSALRGEMYRV